MISLVFCLFFISTISLLLLSNCFQSCKNFMNFFIYSIFWEFFRYSSPFHFHHDVKSHLFYMAFHSYFREFLFAISVLFFSISILFLFDYLDFLSCIALCFLPTGFPPFSLLLQTLLHFETYE